MPRLLLVEQYFYPEGWGGAEIPRDIAVGLRQAGYEVDVLCSRDQYAPMSAEAPVDPRSCGIRIFRVPGIFPGPIHRFKLVRIVWFCLYALPRLLLHRNVDLYITQTNPLLIVPTVALAALVRRKPFIIIAQDLYPEALFASGMASPASLPGKWLGRLYSWSYRRATRVVALGPFMRQRLLLKGVAQDRIEIISNWASGDVRTVAARDNPLRKEWGLEDRFVVLYSGNMGVAHEFETLLQAVKQAASSIANLTLVFIGGGVRLAQVRALAGSLQLGERVVFKSFVSASALPFSLGLADIAVVSLRDGFEGVVVPSKALGYMARGIPILFIGPNSDIAEMVRDADCGACCEPGEVLSAAATLVRAAGDRQLLQSWSANALRCYTERFSRQLALQRYAEITLRALSSVRR